LPAGEATTSHSIRQITSQANSKPITHQIGLKSRNGLKVSPAMSDRQTTAHLAGQ